jgi:hypothetical protein
MGNRPSVDHHQAHQDLAVPWFSIPTMSTQRQSHRTVPLKIAGSQIVENQIDVSGKQIPQAQKQWLLDVLLLHQQLVQGAIPRCPTAGL